GKHVGIFCIGGHGRTGYFTACLLHVIRPDINDPVQWLRDNYCKKVVETSEQVDAIVKFTGKEELAKHTGSYEMMGFRQGGYSYGGYGGYRGYGGYGGHYNGWNYSGSSKAASSSIPSKPDRTCALCGKKVWFIDDDGLCWSCRDKYGNPLAVKKDCLVTCPLCGSLCPP